MERPHDCSTSLTEQENLLTRNPLNNVWSSVLAVVLVGAVLLLGARGRHVQLEPAKPVGWLTAPRVLSLSKPICLAVAARSGTLTLDAEPAPGPDNYWQVACSDATGHDLLHLNWKTDTGELYEVSAPKSRRMTGPLLKAAKAIVLGRLWLRDLQLDPAPAQWPLLRPPLCTPAQDLWSLHFAAAGRHAIVELEAHTGALVYARFLPKKGEKRTTMQAPPPALIRESEAR